MEIEDLLVRLIVLIWVYVFWRARQNNSLPLKARGRKKVIIVYTGWRITFLFVVLLIFMLIPVLVLGTAYLNFFGQHGQNPTALLLFVLAIVIIPTSWIIATIAQVMANHKDQPKRKVG